MTFIRTDGTFPGTCPACNQNRRAAGEFRVLLSLEKTGVSFHVLFTFWCIFSPVIQSFADATTGKLFDGEDLNRKEINRRGSLNPINAFERLAILNDGR